MVLTASRVKQVTKEESGPRQVKLLSRNQRKWKNKSFKIQGVVILGKL